MYVLAAATVALLGSGLLSGVTCGAIEIVAASQRPPERLDVQPADHRPEERYRTHPIHTRVVTDPGQIHAYPRDVKDIVELVRQDVALHDGRTVTEDKRGPISIVAPSGYVERIRPILDRPQLGDRPAYMDWADTTALQRDPEAAQGELTRMTVHVTPTNMPNRALRDANITAMICSVVLSLVGLFTALGLVGWIEDHDRKEAQKARAA